MPTFSTVESSSRSSPKNMKVQIGSDIRWILFHERSPISEGNSDHFGNCSAKYISLADTREKVSRPRQTNGEFFPSDSRKIAITWSEIIFVAFFLPGCSCGLLYRFADKESILTLSVYLFENFITASNFSLSFHNIFTHWRQNALFFVRQHDSVFPSERYQTIERSPWSESRSNSRISFNFLASYLSYQTVVSFLRSCSGELGFPGTVEIASNRPT